MDNKVTKERVNNHMEYDWFKYILIITAAVALVVFIFSQINSNREEETFNMFFSCTGSYSNNYENTVLTKMNSAEYDETKYGPRLLRSVLLDVQNVNDTQNYSSLLSTRGMISSDVLVVKKEYFADLVEEGEEQTYLSALSFLPLDNDVLEMVGLFGRTDIEYLSLDEDGKRVESGGTAYGVRIDTLPKISTLATFEVAEGEQSDEYFMFIFRKSTNIGSYNAKARPQNKQTFFCLKIFFELYA